MYDAAELAQAKRLAFGRIMRMASRPSQEGDVAEYYRCREILMTDAPESAWDSPQWMRNLLAKGAQGD